MSTTTSLFKGGRSGPSIVANDLKKSLVFNRVTRSQDNNHLYHQLEFPLLMINQIIGMVDKSEASLKHLLLI